MNLPLPLFDAWPEPAVPPARGGAPAGGLLRGRGAGVPGKGPAAGAAGAAAAAAAAGVAGLGWPAGASLPLWPGLDLPGPAGLLGGLASPALGLPDGLLGDVAVGPSVGLPADPLVDPPVDPPVDHPLGRSVEPPAPPDDALGDAAEPCADALLAHSAAFNPLQLHPALWRANQVGGGRLPTTATGFEALDAQLPGGGWPHGVLTELLMARPGVGELRLLAPALARLVPAALVGAGAGAGVVSGAVSGAGQGAATALAGRAAAALPAASAPPDTGRPLHQVQRRAARGGRMGAGPAGGAAQAHPRPAAPRAGAGAPPPAASQAAAEAGCIMLFDPPAPLSAWALLQQGLNPQHWLVVQPRNGTRGWPLLPSADVLWALEQALRSGQVAAVLAWLPLNLRADALRRLQLAAQAHDGPVFLFRQAQAASRPSVAPLRVLLQPTGVDGLQLRLVKRRGPPLAEPLRLQLPPVLNPQQQARALTQQALHGASQARGHALDRPAPAGAVA